MAPNDANWGEGTRVACGTWGGARARGSEAGLGAEPGQSHRFRCGGGGGAGAKCSGVEVGAEPGRGQNQRF